MWESNLHAPVVAADGVPARLQSQSGSWVLELIFKQIYEITILLLSELHKHLAASWTSLKETPKQQWRRRDLFNRRWTPNTSRQYMISNE